MISMRPHGDARKLMPRTQSELVVASRDGSTRRVVYRTDTLIEAPNWSPDGSWLIYNADGRLYRLAPDGRGEPALIRSAPVENLNNDHVISPDGASIFASAGDGHIYRLPIGGGQPVRITNDADPARPFRHYLHGISPDAATLAYVGLERRGDTVVTRICTVPAAGGPDRFLTDGSCPVDGPEFSPDGQWIYFNSEAAAAAPGHAQIFRMRPDGSAPEQLTHDARVNWFPHPAPDGTVFSYVSFPPGTLGHPADCDVIVRLAAMDGTDIRDIDRFNGGQGTINVNSWSPDASQMAYVRYPQIAG
jgi:Tol biopolymer transport system component